MPYCWASHSRAWLSVMFDSSNSSTVPETLPSRAIMDASIQQLDAIRALLGNVSGTVDEFEESNITDSQAREWLAQQYGTHLQLRGGHLTARPDAPEAPPKWQDQLGLPGTVDINDEETIDSVLVPAARRKLSQGRLETLSLLVLMGTERIVVTGGKILSLIHI